MRENSRNKDWKPYVITLMSINYSTKHSQWRKGTWDCSIMKWLWQLRENWDLLPFCNRSDSSRSGYESTKIQACRKKGREAVCLETSLWGDVQPEAKRHLGTFWVRRGPETRNWYGCVSVLKTARWESERRWWDHWARHSGGYGGRPWLPGQLWKLFNQK